MHTNKINYSMRRIVSLAIMLITIWSFHIGVTHKHIHILPDGSVVEHSHPFSKTTNPDGSSTTHTFNDFCCLCNFITDELPSLHCSSILLPESDYNYFDRTTIPNLSSFISHKKGRAPPVLNV